MWWAPAIVEKAEISCIVKVQSYHIFFEGALVNGFFNGFQYIGRTIFCAYFFGELLVPLSPGNTNDQIDLLGSMLSSKQSGWLPEKWVMITVPYLITGGDYFYQVTGN